MGERSFCLRRSLVWGQHPVDGPKIPLSLEIGGVQLISIDLTAAAAKLSSETIFPTLRVVACVLAVGEQTQIETAKLTETTPQPRADISGSIVNATFKRRSGTSPRHLEGSAAASSAAL